jgi:DNA-binding winged helix-turn-helix (wHTH) protein
MTAVWFNPNTSKDPRADLTVGSWDELAHHVLEVRELAAAGTAAGEPEGHEHDLAVETGRPGTAGEPASTRERRFAGSRQDSRTILRRTQGLGDTKQPVLQAGGIELDTATRTVRQAGVMVELTSVEFGLLEVLLRSAGQVVTREKLAATVLGRKFAPFDRSIDMHVSKVRRKLGDSEGSGDHIKTIRGVGYMFARPGAKAAK